MAFSNIIFSDDVASFAALSPTAANAFLQASGNDTWALKTAATFKTSLALGNVEDTALSTWAGTTNITTLGPITTGSWTGTAVGTQYGGTGQNFSASDGVMSFSSGTASVAANLTVALGGTGVTTLIDKAVLISQDTGTDAVGAVALTTSGQLLIGGASGPAAGVPAGGTGVTVTASDGGLSFAIGQDVATSQTPTFNGAAMNSQKITSVLDPTADQDAATKAYVDATATGLDVKDSCVVATAVALPAVTYANGAAGVGATLTADANGVLTVDGQAVTESQRVLVKNQVAGLQNGIYQLSTVGAVGAAFILTRTTDADTTTELSGGAFTFIELGLVNDDSGWVCTNNTAITIGTTAITWSQFSGAGSITAGAGMTKSGNTLNVIAGSGITVNADDVQISATYIGQNTITTLGTVATGTWEATDVAVAHGGTGVSTLGDGNVLLGAGANAITSAKAAPAGAFVGTTDSQVLTNKALTSPVLTTPQIEDTSADHQYIFAVSELTSNRTVTLPLLTASDTFVFANAVQTLTNKTLGGYLQPFKDTTAHTTNQTYAVSDNKVIYLFNTSGGVVSFDVADLFSANTVGQTIIIKLSTAGSNLTIDATAGKTIDGAQTLVLEQVGDSATLICVSATAAIVI
jgi:hypothetical protein